MKWTSERTAEGRYAIKDNDGKVVFTSSLPERGESDQVVADRAGTVVYAVNTYLHDTGEHYAGTPNLLLSLPEYVDNGEPAGPPAPTVVDGDHAPKGE